MSLQIGAIHGEVPPAFLRMSSATLAPRLHDLSAASTTIAVAAMDGGVPLGLAVAASDKTPEGEVLSIFVKPERCRQGIGGRLLARAEGELKARGCTAAVIRYHTHAPSCAALERMLAKGGWSAPQPVLTLAKIDLIITEQAKWLQHRGVAAPYALVPWLELKPEQLAQLPGFRGEVPDDFWPLNEKLPADPSSLALLRGDELAGWLVAHRLEADSVRFTILFVRPKWRTSINSFALCAEVARRVRRMYGTGVHCALAVRTDNEEMTQVIARKFKPWAVLWSEMRMVRKSLG
jgi:hypothetical protein